MEWNMVRGCILAILLTNIHSNAKELDLPADHIVIQSRTYDTSHKLNPCWGYEAKCNISKRYSNPKCHFNGETYSSIATGHFITTEEDLEKTFYLEADFGYIKRKRDSMSVVCQNISMSGSILECEKHWQSCRGAEILLDLTRLSQYPGNIRYKHDVLLPGEIRGKCKMLASLMEDDDQIIGRSLSDWSTELKNFVGTTVSQVADLVVDIPVYLVKIEIPFSLYHHMSDFFNFYLTLHLYNNQPEAFSKDIQIVLWENTPYSTNLEPLWEAFSNHPVKTLQHYEDKKVLFKQVFLTLPSRMLDGLYYNAFVAPGCNSSGLFGAFRSFMLHRLNLLQNNIMPGPKVRVTLILRNTEWRRILNYKEIITRLREISAIELRPVYFTSTTAIYEQIKIISQTDVLMGIHGSGLTHMLYLPAWATVFEMYNCGDPRCYKDLARLAGLNYVTWNDYSKIKPINHEKSYESAGIEKFSNYHLDVEETARIVIQCVQLVQNHHKYRQEIVQAKVEL